MKERHYWSNCIRYTAEITVFPQRNFALENTAQVLYRSDRLPSGATHAGDQHRAGVVELVDAPDSKSGSERSVGSSPTTRTTIYLLKLKRAVPFA